MASKRDIARFALTAAALVVTAAPLVRQNDAPDDSESAPVVHVGTTIRTIGVSMPVPQPYVDAMATIQYVIRDDKEKDNPLGLVIRVADDDLREVRLYDWTNRIYSTSLDDIVGTVNTRIHYDAEHSGFHIFRLEAEDASGNTTRVVFATRGNEILTGTFPEDEQRPLMWFAYKDDAWYEDFRGEGYQGRANISDETPYVLEDDAGIEPLRPPTYGFSTRVFDEDLKHLEVIFDGDVIFDSEFTERRVDGREVRNPAEVHVLYIVPKLGDTYEITVRATDSKGNVTEESRTVTVPTE